MVDGFASFSGAYNLLGGSEGMMDAGLLQFTYVYQVAFPGFGQFDFPGATAMSLLVVPFTAFLLFLILHRREDIFQMKKLLVTGVIRVALVVCIYPFAWMFFSAFKQIENLSTDSVFQKIMNGMHLVDYFPGHIFHFWSIF